MSRPRPTPGHVANLVARLNALGNGTIKADDLVDNDGERVERVRVVMPGSEYTGKRYGGAATVRGSNLTNTWPIVRIRAL